MSEYRKVQRDSAEQRNATDGHPNLHSTPLRSEKKTCDVALKATGVRKRKACIMNELRNGDVEMIDIWE